MSTTVAERTDIEDVESFRQRARSFIRENLRQVDPAQVTWARLSGMGDEEELAEVARDRQLQRMFFDAGLAGICFPKEYGGQGLTRAHQQAFNEELSGYEYPMRLQCPTFSPVAPVLLEFGTEEQRRRHIPAMLRGEEIWLQMLSEPSGGSDVASALTTAVRDGDEWVLNGSKVWTSGAWWSDWGLCLARTNWDVPKHRGLTVFMVPVAHEGVEVQRIEMLNGSKEFCQEFMTDVRLPDSDRIGDVDDGWTVGTRWMFHERMLFNSPYVIVPRGIRRGTVSAVSVLDAARDAGRLADPGVDNLVGEARTLEIVSEKLEGRIAEGIRSKKMPEQSAAIGRLFKGMLSARLATLAYEAAGEAAAAWSDDDAAASAAVGYLMRQAGSIGGGTVEMARNVIAERVLGMPRERALDRDVAFRDVPRGRPPGR